MVNGLYALEWILFFLLLIPLIGSHFLGVAHTFQQIWGKIGIIPFPSRIAIYSPIWSWFLLCWVLILIALVKGLSTSSIVVLATMAVLVEVGYALRFRKSALPDGLESDEMSLTHFGLWHNALTEEMLFRGLPLFFMLLLGLGSSSFWVSIYIVGTSLLFGVYHWWRVHPSRFIDTTLFGVLLAFCAWKYSIAVAVFLHLFHNSLSVPIVQSSERIRIWWQYRNRYLLFLSMIVLVSVIVFILS